MSDWLPTGDSSDDRNHNYLGCGKCLFILKIIMFYEYFSKTVIPEANNLIKYDTELSCLLYLSGTKSAYTGKSSFWVWNMKCSSKWNISSWFSASFILHTEALERSCGQTGVHGIICHHVLRGSYMRLLLMLCSRNYRSISAGRTRILTGKM